MIIEMNTLDSGQAYRTLTQTVVPRPIAWVLTENADGRFNLAPFSYFNALAGSPPLVMICVGKRASGEDKDTRANIEARQAFVIHIAHRELLEALNASSAGLPAGVSEVDELGLQTVAFAGSPLPRLADSRVAMSCRLHRLVEVGDGPQGLIIGEVERLYLADAIASRDEAGRLSVDAAALDPLARLGANEYAVLGEIFRIARPA